MSSENILLSNGNWPLDTIFQFNGEKWIRIKSKSVGDLQLSIKGDYVYIIQDNMLLEHICLSSRKDNLNVVYSKDTLAFVMHRLQGVIKVNVIFSQHCQNVEQCFKYIGMFTNVITNTDENTEDKDMVPIKTIVDTIMEKGPLEYVKDDLHMIPKEFPIEEIIQMCLLDDELPTFVSNVELILNKLKTPDPDE